MDNNKNISLFNTWRKKKNSGNYKLLKTKKVHELLNGQNLPVVNHLKTFPSTPSEATSQSELCEQIQDEIATNSAFTPENQKSLIQPQLNLGKSSEYESSDSDSSQENPSEFDVDKYKFELISWAIMYRVNNVQLKALLEIWNTHVPLPSLPVDPRTLLNTPRFINIFSDPEHENEKYWYYGIEISLNNCLKNIKEVPSTISLNFNVDGLPISNASTESFWPILYNIHEITTIKPQIIAIYHGKSKLNLNEIYLKRINLF